MAPCLPAVCRAPVRQLPRCRDSGAATAGHVRPLAGPAWGARAISGFFRRETSKILSSFIHNVWFAVGNFNTVGALFIQRSVSISTRDPGSRSSLGGFTLSLYLSLFHISTIDSPRLQGLHARTGHSFNNFHIYTQETNKS